MKTIVKTLAMIGNSTWHCICRSIQQPSKLIISLTMVCLKQLIQKGTSRKYEFQKTSEGVCGHQMKQLLADNGKSYL